MASTHALLLGFKGGSPTVLEAGSTSELKRKARGFIQTGLPAGVESVEVWSRTEGKVYREDGTRCQTPAPTTATKAAKKVVKKQSD